MTFLSDINLDKMQESANQFSKLLENKKPVQDFQNQPSSFAQQVLANARKDIGVTEDLGKNDGVRIRQYFSYFNSPAGQDWCAAAVSAWMKEAGGGPVSGALGAKNVASQFANANRWIKASQIKPEDLTPGNIAVWNRGDPNSWHGHIGVIESSDYPHFISIEGNSGSKGDSVVRNTHSAKDSDLLGIGILSDFSKKNLGESIDLSQKVSQDWLDKLVKEAAVFLALASQGLVSNKEEAAKILGVDINATEGEIKKAYKAKMLQYHPDKSPENQDMAKMLNAAAEFLLKPEIQEQISTEEPEESDMSYEDIASMRQEMGREKFNKNFPGWERELQSEIGLDAFNRIFEGYDPNDTSDQEDYEEKWRYFEEKIDDEIYNFFSSLEEDLSSRIENTLDKDTVGGDVLYELYEMVDFKPDKISQMTELEPILNRFKFSANNKHVKTSINYSWKQHLEKVIKSISKLIMDDGGDPLLFIDYPNPITCLEAFKHLSDQYIAGLKTHHSPQIRLEVAKKMDTSTLKEMLKNETDRWAQGWMNVELRNRKDK